MREGKRINEISVGTQQNLSLPIAFAEKWV
jgi:hypothetical protein